MAIYMWREYTVPADALYFEANTANSTIILKKLNNPTAVNLETSADGINWTDYTIWNTITLSNVWDKIYMRNKSDTQTWFSTNWNLYRFEMTWSISANWDIWYLLCKNSTNDLTDSWDWCLYSLFNDCTSLTTPPKLPATTLTFACYYYMFYNCPNLEALPELPTLSLPSNCYYRMFMWCSKIKLSTTQTWQYQIPYRIPVTWTWTDPTWYGLSDMFYSTWWTFTSTPSINTTYYTSNQVI